MPLNAPGLRHPAVATKVCKHGQIVVENGFVGSAFKTEQLDRFVDPAAVDASSPPILLTQKISVSEEFEIVVGGIHEAPRSGALDAAAVGAKIRIDPADNALMVVAGGGGTNEVQTITPPGSSTYTITFNGQTTAAIAFDATTAQVQAALEALSNIDPGDVAVTGTSTRIVTFGGSYAGVNVPAMTVSAGSIAQTTGGVSGSANIPVGVVDEIDTVRDIVLINSNAWQAFLPGA